MRAAEGQLPADSAEQWLPEGAQAAAYIDGGGVEGQSEDADGRCRAFEEPVLDGQRLRIPREGFLEERFCGPFPPALPLAGDAGAGGKHFKAAGLAAGTPLGMHTHRQVTDLAGCPGDSADEPAVADQPGGQACPQIEVGA